jgi:hypothetical protein
LYGAIYHNRTRLQFLDHNISLFYARRHYLCCDRFSSPSAELYPGFVPSF